MIQSCRENFIIEGLISWEDRIENWDFDGNWWYRSNNRLVNVQPQKSQIIYFSKYILNNRSFLVLNDSIFQLWFLLYFFNSWLQNNCEPSADDYGLIFLWVAALVFFTLDISYFSAPFVSTERIDGFKHIQLMSNVSAFIYWFSNLMFDSLFLFAIIFVRIVAIKLVDDAGGFLSFSSYPYCKYFPSSMVLNSPSDTFVTRLLILYYVLDIFLLLLWGFIISGLLFSYVINFISSSKEGSYLILFVSTLIGLLN